MIHPIFTTTLRHPDLVARHLANHGALVKSELSAAGTSFALRLAAGLTAVVTLLLALEQGCWSGCSNHGSFFPWPQ